MVRFASSIAIVASRNVLRSAKSTSTRTTVSTLAHTPITISMHHQLPL
jgi:hypothetical protein